MKASKFFLLIIVLLIFSLVSVFAQENCTPEYQCAPWGQCEGGLAVRECNDVACNGASVTERSFCDNPGCKPNLECDSWGPCTYTQRADDLMTGEIRFEGYHYRTCRDVNKCISSFQQEGLCQENNQLQFSPIEECSQKLLAVKDARSERTIAKINLDSWEKNRLDLSFTQGNVKYCPDCFNAKKDQNEEGIDCGGSCKPCKQDRAILYILGIMFLWSGSIIFSFLSVREVVLLRKPKEISEGQIE